MPAKPPSLLMCALRAAAIAPLFVTSLIATIRVFENPPVTYGLYLGACVWWAVVLFAVSMLARSEEKAV